MQNRDERRPAEAGRNLDAATRQAVQWFVKLRSPAVSSADRHAHAEWLEADARHRRLHDQIAKEWADLDVLSDWAVAEVGQLNLLAKTSAWRRASFWGLGLAAAVAVAIGLLPWLFSQPLPSEPQQVRYQTATAEQRQVVLKDGSRMHLNTASLVDVRFSVQVREVLLANGEAMFDVKQDSARPFLVRTGGLDVRALGTRFAVRNLAREGIEVTVLEGRVAVAPSRQAADAPAAPLVQDGQDGLPGRSGLGAVILRPDQQLRIPPGEPVGVPKEVDAAKEAAWLQGNLVFEAAPLREVVGEMSRYMPGRIRIAEDVPDHPVTGIIQIRNPDAMVELLSQVVPITPVKESAEVTVLYASPHANP